MEDGKKEAKAFVDKYFPVKQPNPLKSDILDGIFPQKNQQETDLERLSILAVQSTDDVEESVQVGWKKQGGVGPSSGLQKKPNVAADGNPSGSHSKSQNASQKGSHSSIFVEASDPCPMSSSVDYGCRDYYPSSKPHQGGFDKEKDRKDGYDYPNPENSRGEWWQGSLYY